MSRWSDTRHAGTIEEWVFAAWTPDAMLGVISGHRIVGPTAWYWAALARANTPLLHITDFDVPVRADPFIVKGEAMWAEHFRDAPMEQWSIGNETYAAALDDPADALGRAYGHPTPIAFDLEWYRTGDPVSLTAGPDRPAADRDGTTGGGDAASTDVDGYRQLGVVHGSIEVLGEPTIDLAEVPACRWHRWTLAGTAELSALDLPIAAAHTGIRAPFGFPDQSVLDLVLTPTGWATRRDTSPPIAG